VEELNILYRHHSPWLFGWLRGKVGCHELAADIAQDTFVRLLTGRRAAQSLGSEPRALLTHIAKGLMIDHWRRRDVEQAYLLSISQLPGTEQPSPESRHIIIEALMRIDLMLQCLPAQTRQIFIMAQLDGLKYRQIALQLQIAEITVKRHMRKAFLACLSLD